jgi:glycerophosphoryl diester phosphodiesterase
VSAWRLSRLVVGHRGGRGQGWPPENTIAAFEHARAQGAVAIELDVRTCRGGDAIVLHDVTLARMTADRDRRRVCDVSLEELRGIDLAEGAGVPTLREALVWARERGVAVNVELKHDVPAKLALVREAIRVVRESAADVLISSFDPLLLAMAAALAPRVTRSLLVHSGQALWASALQEVARPPLASCLHLERTQAAPRDLARYRRRGLRLGVWTVNDPLEAIHLVGLGVATLITDVPGTVVEALRTTAY